MPQKWRKTAVMICSVVLLREGPAVASPRQRPRTAALRCLAARAFTLIELLVVIAIIAILAALLLPDQTNGPHLHLLVQGDKVGNIYLIDRDNMGHYNAVNNNQIVQCLAGAELGMWASPTWWNNRVYFGASGDTLKAFGLKTTTGLLTTTPTSQTTRVFAYPGTTTSVSANQDSDAIVWALDTSTYKTADGAVLYAFDATNLATELYTSSQRFTRDNPGGAVKFSVPTVANGKVFVGTQTKLSVYGLLPTTTAKN